MKKQKILILLDAHAILHRAYHALPDFKSKKGEPTGALYGFCTLLFKLIKEFSPEYIVACYDLPEKTYRHDAYKDYKAGRAETDEALVVQLESSKEICQAFGIPIYSSAGFEADDMLGTITTNLKDTDLKIIIASGDMDTMQLVNDDKVCVYTLKKGISDTVLYNEKSVIDRFGFKPSLLPDFKGLRGDPSDNIIGISGVGEKTATVLIEKFGDIENIFEGLKKIKDDPKKLKEVGVSVKMAEKIIENIDDARFSKVLATIRNDAPIYFKLPETSFLSGVSKEKVVSLLDNLDFKSLLDKVYDIFSFEKEIIDIDKDVLKELQILYQTIDSSKINADISDIYSFTKTSDVGGARNFLLKTVKDQGLDFVWNEIEKPLVEIISKMNQKGVRIDKDFLKELSLNYHQKVKSLEEEIFKLSGTVFNIASPKQLAEVLFEKMGLKIKGQKKTKSGSFSTKESELLKLQDENEIIDKILKHREYSKLLGTYIDSIPDLVDKDGRLHPTFVQIGAVTGRMSSENPNVQNIPNKTVEGREIRKSFIAESGFVLVSFDYSQIELRLGAILSGDKTMIEIFRKGEDIHSSVASKIFGIDESAVTKEMRNKAKTINFGVMYGMGVLALKQNLKVSKEEAEEFLRNYFHTFSGLAEYLESVKKEVSQTGFTQTIFGRRRYFPDINSKIPYIKSQAERMAINAPIQGSEADVIKLAMVKVDNFIKNKKLENDCNLIMQIHDELVYEVKDGLYKDFSKNVVEIMQSVLDKEKCFGVVCKANASFGKSLGDLREIDL
jgi:DNA polymerase-1